MTDSLTKPNQPTPADQQPEQIIPEVKNPEVQDKNMILPMVPLRDVVMFPHLEIVLAFGRTQSIKAVEHAFKTSKFIFLTTQKNAAVANPSMDDLYKTGTICRIERLLKTGDEINALVHGVRRAKIVSCNLVGDFGIAKLDMVEEVNDITPEAESLVKVLTNNLKRAVNMGKPIDFLVFMKLMSGVPKPELADQIGSILDIPISQKQALLDITDVNVRLKTVNDLLAKEIAVLEIEHNIASKTQKKFDKSMREAVLRERMKTIQKELGENIGEEDMDDPEVGEFRKKLKTLKIPQDIKEKIQKEIGRLAKMHSYNPESGYIRTYLETIFEMPWGKYTKSDNGATKAEKVLEHDHYGLKEVKERILEYLSVMALRKKQADKLPDKAKDAKNTTILCFSGPPGVGKTSIGKSIAKALGRKFIKVSIGGIRDEAEIRGHRRTYVGAMPGRIIQGLKDSGTMNPVFMLDEIDKIGNDFRGDPSSALLEALDPEQNTGFSDHYLEVPFDLSQVLFITTANVLDTIPPALRDRLEIIRFSGYTDDEKYEIAKKYLYDKTLNGSGLLKEQVTITSAAYKKIIRGYTREAGVRELERNLNKIMRKIAKKINSSEIEKAKVTEDNLHEYLGPRKYSDAVAEAKDDIGISTGLAWTQVGGDILFIEVALMPGKGRIIITGKLGEVMQESCKAALSYIRSHWEELGIDKDAYSKYDFHIHVPEGAVPKDGPSAGVAITTALYSALSKKKVHKDVGMTGEITLRGRVLEIGGLKEKLIAAHRAGLKTVVIPKSNEKDMEEVPERVKQELSIRYADQIGDVLKVAVI